MFRSYRDIACSSTCRNAKLKQESEQDWYSCDFCSEEWLSETEVEIHRIQEHENKIINLVETEEDSMCLYCLRQFASTEKLNEHINVDHLLSSPDAKRIEREIFICEHCSQLFFNKMFLELHMTVVHKNVTKEPYVKCPKCSRNVRVHNVWYHFQFHNIQSVSTCPICLEKCKDRKTLREHVNGHSKHLFCNPCNVHFKKTSTFYNHVNSHDGSKKRFKKVKQFFVPTQPKWKFNRKIKAFNGLNLNVSSKIKICILCREITDPKDMTSHIANHTLKLEPEKKAYSCTCGEKFFNKILMKQHIFKLKGSHKSVGDDKVEQASTTSDETIQIEDDEPTSTLPTSPNASSSADDKMVSLLSDGENEVTVIITREDEENNELKTDFDEDIIKNGENEST